MLAEGWSHIYITDLSENKKVQTESSLFTRTLSKFVQSVFLNITVD